MRKGGLHRSIDDKVIAVEDDEEPTAEDGAQFFPAQAEHLRPAGRSCSILNVVKVAPAPRCPSGNEQIRRASKS
ncbi:hypothetical protein HMPREF0294_2277 [Corynebacterium glucuronolyticum ATCC 51867]|nr:hypothetical protein HMPREF0294_2277 [Corynebacterium glucuronolyticum ATCC 51867]